MLGKWIYYSNEFKKDTYSVYKVKLKTKSKYITLKISADTNYCVYLNKKIAGFGQYACYPYCPTVDTIKIIINREINDIFIVLYYFVMPPDFGFIRQHLLQYKDEFGEVPPSEDYTHPVGDGRQSAD